MKELSRQEAIDLLNEKYENWNKLNWEKNRKAAEDVGKLFQRAFELRTPNMIKFDGRDEPPLNFLRSQMESFPHHLNFFIYSSRYDEKAEKNTIDASKVNLADGLTVKEIFDRKSGLLSEAFKSLSILGFENADLQTVALMSSQLHIENPLVIETPDVPIHDEVPVDYFWWVNFQYFCEISKVITMYIGFTEHFINEITYIRQYEHFKRKVIILDGDLKLQQEDYERQWEMTEIGDLLKEIYH